MLFNTAQATLNETSVADLVKGNHRVVLYVADYLNFTDGGSVHAIDSCSVDNIYSGGGTSHVANQLEVYEAGFKNGTAAVAATASQNRFLLRQFSASAPSSNIKYGTCWWCVVLW